MELSKKQKILVAVISLLVICLMVVLFMVISYDQMEDKGHIMTSEDIAFYQQAKDHINSEYESLAAAKGWKYQSLAGRYHSPQSQYNPEFTITEGNQFCGDTFIQQNINYVTSEGTITCITRFECTEAGWEETVNVLAEYAPAIAEIHNLYGTEELTSEALTSFISDNLPAKAPTDDSSSPDPNDKSLLMLMSSYSPEDDVNHDPHYTITLFVNDYLDEGKLPEGIIELKE